MSRTDPASGRLSTVLGASGAGGRPVPEEPRTEPLPVVRARRRLLRGFTGVRPSVRVDPGRPGATALALVATAAAVLAAIGVWTGRPQAEPISALPAVSVPETAPVAAGTVEGSEVPGAPLVVSVSGRVQRPGLVEVPDGARVADVLDAAGGALPDTDLSLLNLARRVADGEQIAVGVPAAPEPGPAPGAASGSGSGSGSTTPAGKVDLNTATAEQLDTLPGVGPVTVERILAWRADNGRFATIEQLREIEGIGEQRFGRLRELVTV